jgi:hypothetical protein
MSSSKSGCDIACCVDELLVLRLFWSRSAAAENGSRRWVAGIGRRDERLKKEGALGATGKVKVAFRCYLGFAENRACTVS